MPNENLCRAMKQCNSRATKWLNWVSIISVVGDKNTRISSEKIFDGREYSQLFLYVKVVVSRKVVGFYGARRRALKIKSLKHGIIQDKRG